MSTPNCFCPATISTTDFFRSASSLASCCASLPGCDQASRSASGRGKLPACVVNTRSTLRCIQDSFFTRNRSAGEQACSRNFRAWGERAEDLEPVGMEGESEDKHGGEERRQCRREEDLAGPPPQSQHHADD